MKIKITATLLTFAIILSLVLSGCVKDSKIKNLGENIDPTTRVLSYDDFKAEDYNGFAVRLFEGSIKEGENVMVSPLSVALALAMTAEGADGETLEEIEDTLGMDIDESRALAQGFLTKDEQLKIANSMWINDLKNFTVKDEFLGNNAQYYDADVFKAEFNEKTPYEINKWVSDKTDGMVDKIIDELDAQTVLCLVNALAFDAQWVNPCDKDRVEEGEFVTENGKKQTVSYLCTSEYMYLEDDKAVGFIKYYEGGEYAFVAMLPNEGVSVEEYVSSLDGEKLTALLNCGEEATISASIPKFECKTEINLKSLLKDMGIKKAFDEEKADFSKLGEIQGENIYIGDVLHSTKISVTERGTEAGAATAVTILRGAATRAFEIHLNRPFVYMIIDTQNNIPVFMGTFLSAR